MPKIQDIDLTPNPNARKFILKEPITSGVAKSFENKEDASSDILASKMFEFEGITNVFIIDNWITITQDGSRNWDDLLVEVAQPIREHEPLKNDEVSINEPHFNFDDLTEDDKITLDAIQDILDQEIRPYLQADGGDLYIVGFKDKLLQVHYQGACGSCPSSLTGTLMGIESMVKRVDPEISVTAI